MRRFFDLRSPVAGYIAVPRPYVILQRINLGLFAVLGELSATADWRAIAEEIWPFTHGPASTPMGQAETAWQVTAPGHGGVTGLRPHPDAARNWPPVAGRIRGRVIGRRYRVPAGLGERNRGNLLSVLVKDPLSGSLPGTVAAAERIGAGTGRTPGF